MYELNDDPDGLGPEEDIQPEELEDKSYHTAEDDNAIAQDNTQYNIIRQRAIVMVAV